MELILFLQPVVGASTCPSPSISLESGNPKSGVTPGVPIEVGVQYPTPRIQTDDLGQSGNWSSTDSVHPELLIEPPESPSVHGSVHSLNSNYMKV